MFTDTPKMYLAYTPTVAYLPNFSSPIAFTCTVCQKFPPPNVSHVWYVLLHRNNYVANLMYYCIVENTASNYAL